jgi:hypothetical protein
MYDVVNMFRRLETESQADVESCYRDFSLTQSGMGVQADSRRTDMLSQPQQKRSRRDL